MGMFADLFAGKAASAPPVRNRPHTRPQVEVLEDRSVPALISSEVYPLIPPPTPVVLTTTDVNTLLQRAAAADSNDSAIVAIMDRSGHLLGVRVEGGVSSAITGNPEKLSFAIDGAMALARTAAFFSNNDAPLTSRTINFISQSTIIQPEVNSDPNFADKNSPNFGPGFVAPIEIGGNFPPGVNNTPQVDLFNIEASNRNLTPLAPGLASDASYSTITGQTSGAQGRGIGTLPGGVPIFKNGQLVGGIGVFFPGKTGYATEENSILSSGYDASKPDLSLQAEYIAIAALGGVPGTNLTVGNLGGIAPVGGIALPNGRIDLQGITLNIYGPGGTQGPNNLAVFAKGIAQGDPNSGHNMKVDAGGDTAITGKPVPDGWLIAPHSSNGISASTVTQIINQGIAQAELTRSAIRLPIGTRAEQIFAVSDSQGNIVGLYRMPDATVFSVDVAVAKARNVAYYNDPTQLKAVDQVSGIPNGTAFTNRTFRYLAEPYFPEGIQGTTPGPWSILNAPGINNKTGLNTGAQLAPSYYEATTLGFASYNPQANFHAGTPMANQNGIIFFPGSSGVYSNSGSHIVGGFGSSGDGVDQDDVMTAAGIIGYSPRPVLEADNFFVRSIRLPYFNYNRNPDA